VRIKDVYECNTGDNKITASCVILAEGVESRLARSLGWQTHLSRSDVHTCAIARIAHEKIEHDTCVFYLSSKLAPGGYVWVFHRGGNTANVGLGVLGSRCNGGDPKKLLMSFINSTFQGADISEVHCGGVPMGKYIKPLVKNGVMLVGDAAHQVNCVSGAGIAYALYTGKIAGTIAGKSFIHDKCDFKSLKVYEKEWARFYGKQQLRSFSIKEVMVGFSDAFLDDVAKSVLQGKNKNQSILQIFIKAFSKYPLLLFKVIRLLK
jgi:digeranylgeranylglycerophospholipid reductase